MTMNAEDKARVINDYRRFSGDTGSPEVQVALLSARIDQLSGHFKGHERDFHSRQGLLRMVSRRRKLLDYIKRTDDARYQELISRLGLRK